VNAIKDPIDIKTAGTHSRGNWIHFLCSGVILLGCMAWYESDQAQLLRQEVAQLHKDNSALRLNVAKSDRSLQQTLADFHKELDQFHQEFVTTREQTGESLAMAQAAALSHADALASKLESKHRQQEAQERQLSAELSKVKQSTADTSSRLNGISTDVGSVKQQFEAVKSVAQQNDAGLKRAHGDLGMMNDTIATNAVEIQMLRDLGDRNVYEFTLTKSKDAQRVGDIQMVLDRADAKKNQFTVVIVAADQRVEKRDKSINEPVQFYVPGKGSQPYELVVNEVGKNTVKGYLATPKMTVARNDAGFPAN
jgi:chromosome segregation ATPase